VNGDSRRATRRRRKTSN